MDKDPGRARAELQRAVLLEPGYAEAHVALATVWLRTAAPPREIVPPARAAVRRALEANDSLAEAHLLLGKILAYHDYDWENARREYERAAGLNPDSTEVQRYLACYNSMLGRYDEALEIIGRAIELDPVAADLDADAGLYHYMARRYPEAIAQSRRALDLDPNVSEAQSTILLSYLALGETEQARQGALDFMRSRKAAEAELEEVENLPPEAALRTFWRWSLKRIEKAADQTYVSPSVFAIHYLALGDREQAIRFLERGYEERMDWRFLYLRVFPFFDPLRSDPRFQALERRLKFPP